MRAWFVHRERLLHRALGITRSDYDYCVSGQDLAENPQRSLRRERVSIRVPTSRKHGLPFGLQLVEFRQKIGAIGSLRGKFGSDLGDRVLRVRKHTNLGRIVLADFLRVDVDVDELGRWEGEAHTLGIAGRRPVREPAAHSNHDVGARCNRVSHGRPGLPDASREKSVILRERALAVPSGHYRNRPFLCKAEHRLGRIARDGAATHNYDRPSRGCEEPRRGFNRGWIGAGHADRQAGGQLVDLHIRALSLHIHGYLDVHRARSTGQHRTERPLHNKRKLLDAVNFPMSLGHGLSDSRESICGEALQFLKQPVATHVGGRTTGDD